MNRLIPIRLLVLGLSLSACSLLQSKADDGPAAIIRVSGYGAINEQARLSPVQRRLNAMQASRLDAYRVLAERLYGTVLTAQATVKDLSLQDNHLRAYVDARVQGARVLSVNERSDGSFETVLEYVLTQEFKQEARRVQLSQAASSGKAIQPESSVDSVPQAAPVQLYQMRQ